jgi:uncharacterized protein (TIGR02246 family)
MKHSVIAIAVGLLLISSNYAQTGTNPKAADSETLANVKVAIDRGNAQWSEGWAKRDADLVASIFAEDGVQLLGSGNFIKGREEIMKRQKAAMLGADPGVKVTVTTLNVWLDGDTAYETGTYKYEYTVKGTPGKDEGRYVTIWKRQKNGSWKLTMDMGVPSS